MARPLKEKEEDKTLIKQIMREKGITVEDLADKMGKSKPTISYQIGTNMTLKRLFNFAEALGVEVSDLFPVHDGYVHWSQKTGKTAPAPEYPNFCPNCGFPLVKNPKIETFNDPSLLVNNEALTDGQPVNAAFNDIH